MQWHKAKNLIREYNALASENLEEKEKILCQLLGGKGKNLWITSPKKTTMYGLAEERSYCRGSPLVIMW